jgi:ABC-2 type transport system ATP-binding protein
MTAVANGTPLIELQNVSKSYGTKQAVRDLSLTVRPGELFAFLGPNGAGKTTTIKMLTGLLRPTSGRISIAGLDVSRNGEQVRQMISYVPDQPHIYEKLTGREFLSFTTDIYGLSGPEVRSHQQELIELFEMSRYVDDLVETYSHGMRQRLAFAAALVHRPRALIVDEPMVGLDPKSMRIVKDLFRRYADQGACVFMSTHTLAVAEEVADRIGVIDRGTMIRNGTLEELRGSTANGASLEDMFLSWTAQAARP